MNEFSGRWMVLSEFPSTDFSKPQLFLSESRLFVERKVAEDWCDFVKQKYLKIGDDREVFVVKIE